MITFEWAPTATGPWSLGPDYVNTVPGGMTDFFMTGVFTSPEEAPFVAIHFHAGGLMITRGEFEHVSMPLPASGALLGSTLVLATLRRRLRGWSA